MMGIFASYIHVGIDVEANSFIWNLALALYKKME